MESGKISESVLKRSVLKQLKIKREEVVYGAAVGEDCAIFSLSGKRNQAVCMQEGAVMVRQDRERMMAYAAVSIEHLIQRGLNNLAAGGAVPTAVQIALILPEETQEADLKELMGQAEAACSQRKVQIAGGQTLISGAVNTALAVVSAFGEADKETVLREVEAGQDIVVSKWIGLEGTAVLAQCFRERLCSRYPAYMVEEAAGFDRYLSVIPEAAVARKSGVCKMHDASKGGIFGALWELAERAGVGLKVDLKKLPLRQETVEICEYCNVNPYELMSGGSLLMTAADGEALAEALRAEGIPAAVVGKITDGKERVIVNDGEVRYMDRPRKDELYHRLKEDAPE